MTLATWIALFGEAAATESPRGLVVQLADAAALSGAPRLVVTDGVGVVQTIELLDDGTPPDRDAADGRWAGTGKDLVGPDYQVDLSDAGGNEWHAKLTVPKPTEPSLTFIPAEDGSLTIVDAGWNSGGPGAGPGGAPTSTAPAATSAAAPASAAVSSSSAAASGPAGNVSKFAAFLWVCGIGALAWIVAGWRERSGEVPDSPGTIEPLPGEGVVPVNGDADALVAWLASRRRVVLCGALPALPVAAGTVFPMGSARVAVEDVVRLVHILTASGPPLVVVVNSEVESREGRTRGAALRRLGELLPSDVPAYVVSEGLSQFTVAPDGSLLPTPPPPPPSED